MSTQHFEWQGASINVWQSQREWIDFSLGQICVPTGLIAVTDYIAIGCCLFSIWKIETVDGVDVVHLSNPPQIWQDMGDGRITVRNMTQQSQKSY